MSVKDKDKQRVQENRVLQAPQLDNNKSQLLRKILRNKIICSKLQTQNAFFQLKMHACATSFKCSMQDEIQRKIDVYINYNLRQKQQHRNGMLKKVLMTKKKTLLLKGFRGFTVFAEWQRQVEKDLAIHNLNE